MTHPSDSIQALHARILACRLCQDAGYIPRAAPVVSGRAADRMMLIGQAPGQVELNVRKPFAGRAGRELFRWLARIGIDEETFRNRVYLTAITKCYPGKAKSGSGDRRPSSKEIGLCAPYLEAQLQLIRPEVIIPVGGLAIERFFANVPLAELIGRSFDVEGAAVIPLPHPSGASRWLNRPEHQELLARALACVQEAWRRLEEPAAAQSG